MAWRQSPGGSEQHLTRAAAATRTRTQRPRKHLAVHASELVVKPDFQILRRYRRPLLLRLEHTHRPTLEDYVHRATRLGSSRSLNLRIGINFVLLLGPLRSSGRRALSRSTAPSAGRLLRRHGRLENDPDRVRALVSVSRRFGRRVAPELERGFFSQPENRPFRDGNHIGRSHNPSYRSPSGADGARRVHDQFFQSV